MHDIELSRLFVAPLANRIADWVDAGKLGEDDLDRRLTSNVRAIVDSPTQWMDWLSLEDVESLVALVAEQLGGEVGLVEWADSILDDWRGDSRIVAITDDARSLVDGAGFVVAQVSETFVRHADWQFEGGRDRFSVRVRGLDTMSVELKTLLGALLARLGEGQGGAFDDIRFEGVDTAELRIFGVHARPGDFDAADESRLHRAALIA